jgi:hypothetical protein
MNAGFTEPFPSFTSNTHTLSILRHCINLLSLTEIYLFWYPCHMLPVDIWEASCKSMNLYNVINMFHIKWRYGEKKQKQQTQTKNVERHANGLSKLKCNRFLHTLLGKTVVGFFQIQTPTVLNIFVSFILFFSYF